MMKNLGKKISAIGVTVIMMASISAMGASAISVPVTAGNYTMTCSSAQQNSHTWKLTSSINKANTNVNVSGIGTYYINVGKTTKTTGNGNGSGTSGVTTYLVNSYGYGWKSCTSTHKSTVTYSGWVVSGKFVNK